MNKAFLIKLAYRNLMIHKMRTILTLLAIIIGISAIVFLVSFGFGIEKLVTKEVTGGDAFKLIDIGTGNSQVIKLDDKSIENIKGLSGAKDLETTINIGAKVKYNNSVTDSAFYGTSEKYIEWSGLKPNIGNGIDAGDTDKVLVNSAFVEFLKSSDPKDAIGKKITFDLILPKELTVKDNNETVPDKEFTIVGIIKSDSAIGVYTNQDVLKKLGIVNYSQAKLEMESSSKEKELRSSIENMGLKTQYVGDTVSQIQQIFSIFTIILSGFGLIALIVASLGMFNTLTISLMERMKEIALMKILGIKKKDVRSVFITESVIFGIVGGILGILLWIALSKIANSVLNYFAINAGADKVDVFYFPFWFILIIFAFSVLIGFLTGLYPSRRAAKVAPLDVMRYE